MSRDPAATTDRNTKSKLLGPRFFALCGLIVIVAGGIVVLAISLPAQEKSPPPARAGVTAGTTGSGSPDLSGTLGTPKPWEYNERTNQHWDPTPGHQHWHPGPPPVQTGAEATTPEPWFYNEQTDQYWDPGHNHWHDGKPPPPDQRP